MLHAVPGAWLPQTETWLYNQVRFLPETVESHVACDRVENLDQFPFHRIHCEAGRRMGIRRERNTVRHAAFETRPHVIHSHFGPEGWRNLAVADRNGSAHVVSFYGYDVNYLPRAHPRWRRRYREVFERADLVLCEGEHMAQRLAGLGCRPHVGRVHRLGVDLAGLDPRPRRWRRPQRLRVLIASTFREKKGIPVALEALGAIRRDVDLEVTIVGDATAAAGSAQERERILTAVADNGLAGRVHLPGMLPHAELLERAYRHHLFVAGSLEARDGDTEGGAPVTIIEMAATAMPIVSTFHCDIPGVVRHGESGFLARENDADDLARQLRRMIALCDRWPSMGINGRRWVESRFDAITQGRRLAAMYEEVAARRLRGRMAA